METESNNTKTKHKKLIYIIIFAGILYGLHYKAYAWTESDQRKYEERLQQGQAQSLEMAKELAKIQADSLREQEQIKLESKKRAESPLMNSSQKDFTSSLVINKNEKANNTSKNIGNAKPAHQNVKMPNYNLNKKESESLTKEEVEMLQNAYRLQNLKALQLDFFTKNYDDSSNTLNVLKPKEHTIKIRTRYAMTSTIIMESKIVGYILGDSIGFEVKELPHMENALSIRPKLIGIDTNLTIFTQDKRIYNLYVFSTDYKSKNPPNLIVNIQTPYTKEEKEQLELEKKKAIELDRKTYLTIGNGIDSLKIKREDIDTRYIQKTKKKYAFLFAEQVFSDKQFTYFKYDKEKMPEMPAVWVVVDKKDSPIASRIIGDYLVAETTADNFTIRIGDAYVCVRKKK
ncbi:TrbG/VirB9 family P-type conjugative transfer protein [Helicobacter bilis]|uniref:TrbG/VirB9 family P-type conjugative transfer protein n=1 Tax=Helicobacter bilis TaxID=37372 RepID=UPI002557F8E4|nr:TrbG/VirB9 family P-type conjugative transfer protein [Helicobacter bilis]